MSRSRAVFVLGLLALAATTQAGLSKLFVEFDMDTDFKQYKTYVWSQSTPADDLLADQRVVAAIENQLAIKGLIQLTDGADLFLFHHASIDEAVDLESLDHSHPSWREGESDAWLHVPGAVVVEFIDGYTGVLVWRGVVHDTVRFAEATKDGGVNKAVERLLKSFPPTSKMLKKKRKKKWTAKQRKKKPVKREDR